MINIVTELFEKYGTLLKFIGVLVLLGNIVWFYYKRHIKKKDIERDAVNSLLNLFDDSIWTFYPINQENREKIKVVHELSWLFKSCSIKSSTKRLRPHESNFINALTTNYRDTTNHLMYQGAVEFDISNRNEIMRIFHEGQLPVKFIAMKTIFENPKNMMNIDCIDGSLNDIIVQWKEIILNYDNSIHRRFSWAQRQPYI